jgi:hypothetical protein
VTVQNVTLSRRLDFNGRAPFLVACGKLVKTLKEKLREGGKEGHEKRALGRFWYAFRNDTSLMTKHTFQKATFPEFPPAPPSRQMAGLAALQPEK